MPEQFRIETFEEPEKVIRIALANGWIEKDPFYGIHFKMDEVNVEFLSQEELDRLMEKDFEIKRLEQVRDVFAFCCYTGLAFADVHQLSKEHLVRDNDGNLWIRKARQKQSRCVIFQSYHPPVN